MGQHHADGGARQADQPLQAVASGALNRAMRSASSVSAPKTSQAPSAMPKGASHGPADIEDKDEKSHGQ